MIIQLKKNIGLSEKNRIVQTVSDLGYKSNEVKTNEGFYLVCIGKLDIDIRRIGNLDGIADVHRVSEQYKLVSRKWKLDYKKIDLGDGVIIGGKEKAIIAGPCSIESEEQVE